MSALFKVKFSLLSKAGGCGKKVHYESKKRIQKLESSMMRHSESSVKLYQLDLTDSRRDTFVQ